MITIRKANPSDLNAISEIYFKYLGKFDYYSNDSLAFYINTTVVAVDEEELVGAVTIGLAHVLITALKKGKP